MDPTQAPCVAKQSLVSTRRLFASPTSQQVLRQAAEPPQICRSLKPSLGSAPCFYHRRRSSSELSLTRPSLKGLSPASTTGFRTTRCVKVVVTTRTRPRCRRVTRMEQLSITLRRIRIQRLRVMLTSCRRRHWILTFPAQGTQISVSESGTIQSVRRLVLNILNI